MRLKAGSGSSQSPKAFVIVALAFLITMTGTTLPTAIYHDYQIQYGFATPVMTLIYAVYALGVFGALLTVGNWSDQLGRRRMLIAGLCFSAASAICFLLSNGLLGLMLGRLLSGISAGIFTGTATVAVIELVELAPPAWRQRATLVATASNMLGLGCGPLLGGILVDFLPWPTRLPYAVHLLLVIAAALAVFGVPETAQLPHRIRLGVQKMSLPVSVRETFIPAALAGFAGFMVIGFFAAVAPQLIRTLLGFHSTILIGTIVFLFFLSSACGQVLQAHLPSQRRQPVGCLGLIAGLLGIALCAVEKSLGALLIGTVAAGLGQGISFRAGLSEISARTPPRQRAEVTSSFFVVLYIAISAPVIGIGIAVQAVGIQRATIIFSSVTAILVAVALLLLMRRRAVPTAR